MKFTAAGDMLIQQRIFPEFKGYENFQILLSNSGVGRNLAEASAPRYLETAGGRVALIAVNTSFEDCMMAGEQSPRVPGRPGINGLRLDKYIQLPQKEFDLLKQIAKETNINAEKEITRKEGYHGELADDEGELGELTCHYWTWSTFIAPN